MYMQTKLKTARYWLLVSLVFATPMSFTPSVALPVFDFPSFRIGLYQVLALLFVLACTPLIARGVRQLLKSRLFLAGALLITTALVVGLLTTLVPARTALYSTSLIALLLLGIAGYLAWTTLEKRQKDIVLTSLLWSGVVFGGLALVQLLLASFDRTALGTLCTGCSDAVFGFPRINLFAAEPQFFANSLFPALFAAFFFRSTPRLANWALILTSLAIGLTFSRGALLALAVSWLIYLLVQLMRKQPVVPFLRLCLMSLLGILIAFGLLIGSATLRYRETPYIAFNTAVSMLDHVSLGVLSIPQKAISTPAESTDTTNEASDDFVPEGLVEESSNDRLAAASLALDAWNDSLKTIVFGVGMGNLGAYVNEHIADAPSNLTVYIWYILVLAELGIVGLVGLLLAPLYVLWRLVVFGISTPLRALAFTVTVAFLVQLFSFGTYINIMYQYLFVGIFVAVASRTTALRTP